MSTAFPLSVHLKKSPNQAEVKSSQHFDISHGVLPYPNIHL